MGCGCGKRRSDRQLGVTTSYVVFLPDGTEQGPFLSAIEAKQIIRSAGGGTIKRQTDKTAPAS